MAELEGKGEKWLRAPFDRKLTFLTNVSTTFHIFKFPHLFEFEVLNTTWTVSFTENHAFCLQIFVS